MRLSSLLIAAVGLVLGIWTAAHALLNKRRPQSAFAWIAVAFSMPFAGALLYYVFGINRVKERAKRLLADHPETLEPGGGSPKAPAGREALAALGAAVTGLPLVPGNAIEVLHDGEHAFPPMLAAIRGAERRVLLATYIFDTGPTGARFCDALESAVKRGVDVHVLLDGVGELYSWPLAHRLLARRQVPVARFLPPRLRPPAFTINLRNHRKILAVDGITAFTGGINIGDRYLAADERKAGRVKDIHFRLTGPVVRQIEAVFAHDWRFVTRESLRLESPPTQTPGHALCRTIADGPHGDTDRLTELLVGAIGQARHRIAIMTPYFLPPRELTAALGAAALQGLDVAVILPAHNNLPYVHRATRHMLWELLERGTHIYYQPPPFVHSKFLLIDDDYAQIGSANLDPRSLRLNFELNVEVYDRELVANLAAHFDRTRRTSTPITLEQIEGRALATKLIDGVAWLFSPYL